MNKIIEIMYSKTILKYCKLFSRKGHAKFVEKSIEKYCKKSSDILSIGAGGQTKYLLTNKKLNFVEIDIDKKRNPDYVMDICNLKFNKEKFDVIFCLEVLEHVKDPFKAVKEMKKVLKKGGIIIASTPFGFPIHEEPVDFFRYTKFGIKELFKEFKCLHLKEKNSYIESMYVILIRLLAIGSIKQRAIGILFFPIMVLILPFVFIFNLFIDNYHMTTGYNYIFKKV